MQGVHLLLRHIFGDFKYFLSDGADELEGRGEYNTCFLRMGNVLIGIADGNWSHGSGSSTSHTADTEGDEYTEAKGVDNVISQ